MPFFTVPKMWHWGVGIKRPTSVGIKIPTSHFFRVGWDATLIRVKQSGGKLNFTKINWSPEIKLQGKVVTAIL